jgi:hypothetical protein
MNKWETGSSTLSIDWSTPRAHGLNEAECGLERLDIGWDTRPRCHRNPVFCRYGLPVSCSHVFRGYVLLSLKVIAIVVPTAVASFRTHRHSELSTHWTGTASAALTVVICRLLHGHSERQCLSTLEKSVRERYYRLTLPVRFPLLFLSFLSVISFQINYLNSSQIRTEGKRKGKKNALLGSVLA